MILVGLYFMFRETKQRNWFKNLNIR
jgi:hypothetical protein